MQQRLRRAGGFLVATVAFMIAAAGCASEHTPSPDGIIRIVAGFYPLQFVAEQVGGERVRVTSLTQPGVEPHDLELSPRQVASVADADLVVYLGGFQPAVDQATEMEARGRAFDAADMVKLRPAVVIDTPPGVEADHVTAKGDKDPHIWLDPTRLATVADALADRLATIDPPHGAAFRGRASTLHGQLDLLDGEYKKGLTTCERRDIVVSHAAFGYMAERYGLHQIPITGISPDSEPTPSRLANVAEQARRHNATTIFFETLASPKLAQALAREIGADTAVLDPIEGLANHSTDTYLSVMRRNLETLKTALSCR
jgi:zinc transport system substrate-binding protein